MLVGVGLNGTYYYEEKMIIILTNSIYTFQSISNMATKAYLYNGTFDPTNVPFNLLTSNNNGGPNQQFRFEVQLKPSIYFFLYFEEFL